MASKNERECIDIARAAMLASAKRRLAELQQDDPESDVEEYEDSESHIPKINSPQYVPSHESWGFRILYYILLFILLPIALPLRVYYKWRASHSKPNIKNIEEQRMSARERRIASHRQWIESQTKELNARIELLESKKPQYHVPVEKSVVLLWKLQPWKDSCCNLDEEVQVLDSWLAILYGPRVAEQINLRQQVDDMLERRREANRVRVEEDGPMITFIPLHRSLLRMVEGLPPYE